jgi:hypothetical protein
MGRQDGKILNTLTLYSEEALVLLSKACEKAESSKGQAQDGSLAIATTIYTNRYADSSSDEEEEKKGSSSSEASDESENEQEEEANIVEESVDKLNPLPTTSTADAAKQTVSSNRTSKPKKSPRINKENRQRMQLVKQYTDNLVCESFPLDDDRVLELPSSLLGKEDRRPDILARDKCRYFLNLSEKMQKEKAPVVVLLLRSGRFAGGVFQGDRCVTHRAFQRYTVRKGQGKSQSSQDNSKSKAKSVGAQLRRAGEQSLKEDIHATVLEWKEYIQKASLILLSCPKTMKTTIFADVVRDVVSRDDARIRKIPFDVGRPTFDSVCVSHEVLMGVVVREAIVETKVSEEPQLTEEVKEDVISKPTPLEEKEEIAIPLTPLHEASRDGDLPSILDIISKEENTMQIDRHAGPDFMTPLHYAAESSQRVDPATAAACVSALLIQGRANPGIIDARTRASYFLASHDKVREAFRRARAILGEDHCDWNEAKVGPPLTEDDIEARKEKEAEKKRKKKARAKEKKAQEKDHMEEMEQRKKEEEEQKKRAEDAKRVRDCLQPKARNATNICDFCQKVCKGKQRTQMFKRLDYNYCSTDCLNKHKRELMAKAAMSRFGT